MSSKFNKGDQVFVEYYSSGRVDSDGTKVSGNGIIDRVEDGYCYGRRANGGYFCCPESDVKAVQLTTEELAALNITLPSVSKNGVNQILEHMESSHCDEEFNYHSGRLQGCLETLVALNFITPEQENEIIKYSKNQAEKPMFLA